MGSDEDYAAFLDKANQDLGGSKPATTKSVGTQSVNTEVPKALQEVDEYYVSDADEPFQPVSLKWDGKGLPSEDVTAVKHKDFDPRGEYAKVVDAVKGAGSGDVGFFRVDLGGTRSEYYIVSVDDKGGRIVGLKAKSVES
ncbi:hypothetical protein NA57DRAFT_69298 [Rhizodiscina lignyota]|uniref:Uncharacterized protein n=1 Tax=Rhizodiscina lignyota TaxID=1504668 RepID=A0A9P4M032_9PEZI|nr:hypothetical protein NA57DRAFT_69298 [Rhizodiscina lignyota]